jgi:ribosomal protein S18 acetylase RimI-like enzyme
MSLEVRAASEADLDVLVRLNRAVQTWHAAQYPDDFKPIVDPSAVKAFFAHRLDDPKSAIAIAEADRLPIGYVWSELQARPETPFNPSRPRIYIHHVAVLPDARRRGAGAALVNYVEQRASGAGIVEIALDTWAANLDAQSFFGSRGFAAFNIAFRKKLSPIP